MTFVTRQVKNKDLSERLVECRSRVGLSVTETATLSGIQPKFIVAFEEGRIRDLPASVYVKGFLRSLAKVYRVDGESLLRQFASEQVLDESVRAFGSEKKKEEKVFVPKFVMSPKSATIIAIGLLGVLSFGYLYFQVSSLRRPPTLEISSPGQDMEVSSSLMQIVGKVEPGATVTINGQNVVADTDGNFKENLSLGPGANQLVVRAVNKFGQETVATRSVVFSPTPADDETGEVLAADIRVRLEVVMQDASSLIELTADGALQYAGTMLPGARREVAARDKVVLSTGNAGATRVILNGKDLGLLGKSGEALRDIEFGP